MAVVVDSRVVEEGSPAAESVDRRLIRELNARRPAGPVAVPAPHSIGLRVHRQGRVARRSAPVQGRAWDSRRRVGLRLARRDRALQSAVAHPGQVNHQRSVRTPPSLREFVQVPVSSAIEALVPGLYRPGRQQAARRAHRDCRRQLCQALTLDRDRLASSARVPVRETCGPTFRTRPAQMI